jgi:hypothetical protein
LPLEKSLDTFDLARLPNKIVQQIRSFLDGQFLDRTENILAIGNLGSGKTHLLCAIGQAIVQQGHKVYFTVRFPCGHGTASNDSYLLRYLRIGRRPHKLIIDLAVLSND